MNQFVTPQKTDSWLGSKVLNRYQINRCIGEGGMGIVYEAEDLKLGRRVAIKRLNDQHATNPQALTLFVREAMAASRIGNEHIIHVNDIYSTNSPPFMVLEFLEGQNLDTFVTFSGPPPLHTVARIIVQICDALESVHAQGIIHRDLKPDNVFLIHQGANPEFVKVLDFGVARFKTSFHGHLSSGTVPGQPIGTLQYMSPEQLHGLADIDHRTDIYSLGAVLFFSLTSSPPFNADSFIEIAEMITNNPAPSIGEWRKDLPAETISKLDGIVFKALEKKREKRYQSALELKRDLWHFSDKLEHQFSLPPVASLSSEMSIPPSGISRWGVPFSVAVLTGAIFALATYTITQNREPTKNRPIPVVQPSPSATKRAARSNQTRPFDDTKSQSKQVTVRISTVPAEARLFLDGKAVSNPFVGRLANDGKRHQVKAELDGYLATARSFIAEKDLSLPLSLALASESDSLKSDKIVTRPSRLSTPKETRAPQPSSEVTSAPQAVTVDEGANPPPSPAEEIKAAASLQGVEQPAAVPPATKPKSNQTKQRWRTTEPLDDRVIIVR
ncbi:MAG: serine/threonine protein kinase [Deltaproteobacteria bacterium]|nr:serine/threonine protein kinase [Deltaproteobacteria bacterium]